MQGRDQNHKNKPLQMFEKKKCTLKEFEKIGKRRTAFVIEIKN